MRLSKYSYVRLIEHMRAGTALPLTKRERKALIKALAAVIYRTFSDARIASMGSYDDTLLSRLDRIQGHANAQMVQFVEGL